MELNAVDGAGFTDHHQISSYAADDIAALAAEGLIKGDALQQLMPIAHSTRAEASMLIYRILMQQAEAAAPSL
ncbi:S-layer homology domain-containing protein [Paenibacillus sp. MMS20-IR301]|uniref:S-layer homology domain-containing protein n=1 Tax=Paenibacillus sp. MMS20-IR301 TaxID=2895946 RepID=UPI0028EE32C4|nr:hypothetical protein [Paenibacillus sp. MMS20-IR301]WNS43305.1 hypothetical protein LOS79_30945 [Paenibacillus sp. MMS20-IR301]